MSQEKSNHCMLFSIHKRADETWKKGADVFCEANEERKRTFGIFFDTDFLQLNVSSVDILN